MSDVSVKARAEKRDKETKELSVIGIEMMFDR